MTSRKEIIYCEHCNVPCYFDYESNKWSSDNGPMFTGRHCSRKCYHLVLRSLELEFTLNTENRINIVRRLNMYRELDKYRCKDCGGMINRAQECRC